jgi:hypothetical protein
MRLLFPILIVLACAALGQTTPPGIPPLPVVAKIIEQ